MFNTLLDELKKSAEDFEASHPELVALVTDIPHCWLL
jgi:hypothetical protein